jgi:hypothetical protein
MSYFSITASTDGQDDIDFFSFTSSADQGALVVLSPSGYSTALADEPLASLSISAFDITYTNTSTVEFFSFTAPSEDSLAIPLYSVLDDDYSLSLADEPLASVSINAYIINIANSNDIDFFTFTPTVENSYAIGTYSVVSDYSVTTAYEPLSSVSVNAFEITFTNEIVVDFWTYSPPATDSSAIPINSIFDGYPIALADEPLASVSVNAFEITFTNTNDIDFWTYSAPVSDTRSIPVSILYGTSTTSGAGGTGTGRKQIWSQY